MSGQTAWAAVPFAFLILIVATYFIVGSVFRYRRGMRKCPEMLPNYRFWRRVVSHIAAGVVFVVTCGRVRSTLGNDGVAQLPNEYSFKRVGTGNGGSAVELDDLVVDADDPYDDLEGGGAPHPASADSWRVPVPPSNPKVDADDDIEDDDY